MDEKKTRAVLPIWREMHDRLRTFIATRVSNEAEVDDIVQEVFLRVHRRLGQLRHTDRIVAWIFQIARHVIVDYYRAPQRNREVPVGLADALEAAFSASDDRKLDHADDQASVTGSGQFHLELAACLRPMLDRLSKEYREAITLVELNGLTHQAAAKQLGLSASGMKSRVQRGRRQLKQMLDDCCLIELDQRGGVIAYEARDADCDPCRRPETSTPQSCR
jgi:RNA polymerase sigma-70 factor (ECF subfamily)